MKTFHGFFCPNCGEGLAAPVVAESILSQDKYIKVNFVRVEVPHECPSRRGPVENTGS